ncbi:MAG: hypothetical protein NTY60_04365 [Proteobacteria bacterium]|nr:hypothetical protein [Pseudomonadota bacterium]
MWPLTWRCGRFEFWGLACHKCGSQKGWRVSSCSQRLYSFVAAVTCRNCGAEYFLKKYRHAGHQCEAQWEYRMLQKLESDNVIAHIFLTPHVYDICTSTCAFSMELLAGQCLDERIKKTLDKQVFDDSLRLAATWLRGLHHYPAHGELGHTHTEILSQIESASLSALNPVAHSGLELMRNSLVNLEQIPAKPVPLHGDFKVPGESQSGRLVAAVFHALLVAKRTGRMETRAAGEPALFKSVG